ncbi:MAG: sodium/solute symporter, partial [Clostridia bacterium]
MFIKILLLVIFIIVMLAIGFHYRRTVSNVSDFVLGGRNVGPWVTAFAYGTSYFSAVVFVGYAGQFGWNFGVSATWIGLGNAFIGSLLAWVLLGRRTRVMSKHFEASTMSEFFEKRYNSTSLKILSSIIIFVFLIPYSASVYKGLSGLFSVAFNVDFTYCIIGMALLTAIYVILGGYMATAINDLIQGIIMLFGIVFIVFAVLNGQGGFTAAMTKLSQIDLPNVAQSGALTSFFGPDPINLLGVVILTSVGTWGLPQMVHKFYTVKNEKTIKTGTIISTVFAVIIAGGSYFMGSFGRLYMNSGNSPAGGYDQIVPNMLKDMPDLLIGIVIILVLSASMSTLSSIVLTSSSTFTIDFLKGFAFKKLKEKSEVKIIRILCAVSILFSVILALNPSNLITTLMSVSWGTLAGCFLGPFLYGLFWRKVTKSAVFASFITGIGITGFGFIISIFKINLPSNIAAIATPPNFGALAIIVSLIIVPLVSLVTPKLSKEYVDSAFECYDEKIVTEHKFS